MAELHTYNYEDINRYLEGRMTPPEMHDFEKAMHDDPFLEDAIEGFLISEKSIAKDHLAAIEKQLTAEKQDAKVIPLTRKAGSWWKVAAIILVIVTGGALSYQLMVRENTTVINKPLALEEKAKASISSQADSFSPTEKPMEVPEIFPKADIEQKRIEYKSEGNSFAKAKSPQLTFKDTDGDGVAERLDDAVAVMKASDEKRRELTEAKTALATKKAEETYAFNMTAPAASQVTTYKEFKGRITDTTGSPLAFAEIKAQNNKAGTIADASGNFTIKAPDSVLDVTVKSIGYENTRAKLSSAASVNKIILQESNQTLSEVVVTNMKSRKDKAAKNKMEVTVTGEKNAEPIGGWKKFEEYVNDNIDNISDDVEFGTKEEFQVEFELDNKGRPTNIVVPNNPAYSKKINSLLKKGPRWKKPKDNERIKVTLKLQ